MALLNINKNYDRIHRFYFLNFQGKIRYVLILTQAFSLKISWENETA